LSRHGIWEDERGFTLVEVLITIILIGLVNLYVADRDAGSREE